MPGSLSEIRPGVWKVRVYVGANRVRSATFPAKGPRSAAKLAASHTASILATADEVRAEVGTVTDLLGRWVRHRRTDSPATIQRRASIVATIRRDLGHIKLDKLGAADIDEWYHKLREEPTSRGMRSEATVHHYHRVLHAVLAQGYRWGMIDGTPAARATPPKHQTHRRPVAPPVAIVNLLIAAATPDLAMAARMLAATGLRRGELVGLRWTDIDLEAETVYVHRSLVAVKGKVVAKEPKNAESIRVVAVDPTTIYELHRHKRRWLLAMPTLAVDAYLFPDPHSADRTGRVPRSPDWLSGAWRALCAKHGAKVRLHDLRHFHATALLGAGVPLHTVSARLGHALVSTTSNIYGHALDGSDREAATTIGRQLMSGA